MQFNTDFHLIHAHLRASFAPSLCQSSSPYLRVRFRMPSLIWRKIHPAFVYVLGENQYKSFYCLASAAFEPEKKPPAMQTGSYVIYTLTVFSQTMVQAGSEQSKDRTVITDADNPFSPHSLQPACCLLPGSFPPPSYLSKNECSTPSSFQPGKVWMLTV